jgi:hypothetical protein
LGDLEIREARADVARLLEMDDAMVRTGAAAWLVEMGFREGLPVLLRDYGEHSSPNALREPEAYRALRRRKVMFDARETPRALLERLGKEAGLSVEFPKLASEVESPWDMPQVIRLMDPTPLVRVLTMLIRDPYSFLLEKGKIVIVRRDEALRYWKEWK